MVKEVKKGVKQVFNKNISIFYNSLLLSPLSPHPPCTADFGLLSAVAGGGGEKRKRSLGLVKTTRFVPDLSSRECTKTFELISSAKMASSGYKVQKIGIYCHIARVLHQNDTFYTAGMGRLIRESLFPCGIFK